MKKQLIALVFAVFISSTAISQNVWQLGGNNVTGQHNTGILGTKNLKSRELITNNIPRLIIDVEGNVYIENDLFVKGKINGIIDIDNLIAKYLSIDSIKARMIEVDNLTLNGNGHTLGNFHVGNVLQIGDSTFYFVSNVTNMQGFDVDHIRSDKGIIALMEGDDNSFTSNIQVGIGTTTPMAGMMLDVNGMVNISHLHSGYSIAGNEILQYHGSSSTPVISNIFVGVTAGMSTSIGSDNAFMGYEAGRGNTEGKRNTALGSGALRYSTIENNNTAIGFNAFIS